MPKIVEFIDTRQVTQNVELPEEAREFIQAVRYLIYVCISVTILGLVVLCYKRNKRPY